MRKEHLIRVLALLAVLCASAGVGHAEDIKRKFYVGGTLGVNVYTDAIRNNAALIISPLGDDGAPFTGDEGEIVACEAQATVFCDPRPDDLIARETQIEDTIEGRATFGYGLTSLLSLELDVGYFKGQVNNFDVFTTKRVPQGGRSTDPCVQAGLGACDLFFLRNIRQKQPITAGDITLTPVEFNAIVRFRKDSNFNPYLGGGLGYLFTSVDVDRKVDDLNDRLSSVNVIAVTDEFGRDFGTVLSLDPNTGVPRIYGDGNAPFEYPVEVEIDDGFQFQVLGGGEYFFNDRFSVIFDARYTIAGHKISILMDGQDQINVETFPEEMFREDGSVKIFTRSGQAPNPIDPNNPSFRFNCDVDGDGDLDFYADYDGDGNLLRDPTDPDQCFNPTPGTPAARGNPTETIIVQGGTIKLTHFTFGFGFRFTF
jgi:hypothetical protein